MKYAVTSEQMNKIDDYTVNMIKIPSLVLMERAAIQITDIMKREITKTDRILAVCGPGNNGGDGIAAGRILYLQGYQVALLFLCEEDKFSDAMKAQLEIARNLGMTIENYNKLHEYNIIIDAVFGVGLSRPVSGIFEKLIKEINRNDNVVYSVDVPSGISSDSGKVMNAAIKANITVTFGYQKLGLLLYPGASYAGEIILADIGFPEKAFLQVKPEVFYYEKEDLCRLPLRKKYSHKGTYGKVLLIAGSKGMSGAAYLSALAAYRTGAGLVKLLTSSDNREILQTLIPEAIYSSYDPEGRTEQERREDLISEILWATVIIIGPGIGMTTEAKQILELVCEHAKVPVVVDADALTMLAKELDLDCTSTEQRVKRLSEKLPKNTVLTPHLMELSRLTGISVSEITDNIIDTVNQCSYNNKLIYAIKDARTIVADSSRKYINLSGNNGMATGGSGDVLTGIIAALIAQGLPTFEAACLGVYIHGRSGDAAAARKGMYSLIAGDIADSIEAVIKEQDNVMD